LENPEVIPYLNFVQVSKEDEINGKKVNEISILILGSDLSSKISPPRKGIVSTHLGIGARSNACLHPPADMV
jgi:hypothetical protein